MGCSSSTPKKDDKQPPAAGTSNTDKASPEPVKSTTDGKASADKPAKAPAPIKVGDLVMVAVNGGIEGTVVTITTTDIVVKDKDGQEKSYDIEDVMMVPSRPPLETEVKVGEEVTTEKGLTGTVTKRNTLDVLVKPKDGDEVWVDIEDITYLRLFIVEADGLHDKSWAGKSDPYCTGQLRDKPKSKVRTALGANRLDPIWNYEAAMISYARDDILDFEVYDQDSSKKDDFLGKASLTADQLTSGFYGDLPLLDKAGDPTMGTLRVNVRVEHLQPAAEDDANGNVNPDAAMQQSGITVVELSDKKVTCCC